MFLMLQLPEIKDSIKSGELDLSKCAAVQNHIRIENEVAAQKVSQPNLFGTDHVKSKLTKDEKLEVVKSMMGKSAREAMRYLLQKSSAPEKLKRPEEVTPLSHESNEVRLVLSDEDLKTLKEIKELLAHKHPNASLSQLVSLALREAKESFEYKKSGKHRHVAGEPIRSDKMIDVVHETNENLIEERRTPSTKLKRLVYLRAKGQCEICESKNATEYDHVASWALGGKNSFENMRLLCRNCHQREAFKIFGRTHYVRAPQVVYQA